MEKNLYKVNVQNLMERLNGSAYIVVDDKILYNGGSKSEAVANFIPEIIEIISHENGINKEILYRIKATIIETGEETEVVEITPNEFNSFSFISKTSWIKRCIVEPKSCNYSKLRQIAQIVSRDTVKETVIYQNTGFVEINNKKVYVYHGGCIGLDNLNNRVADLSKDNLELYCFTDKNYEVIDALRTSFSILTLADYKITIALICTIYKAPITSILQDEGIMSDNIVFLLGNTGTHKSSIAAIALNHFGDKFSRNNLPGSFKDTANCLERKAFILKDSILVIDDLDPQTLGNQKLITFGQVFGIYGDKQGRGRMNTSCNGLSKTYTARGDCLITAEYIPANLSEGRLARSIIINIKKDSINLDKLTILQNNKSKLAYAMKIYIQFIIEQEDWIRNHIKSRMNDLQAEKRDSNAHGRTTEAINVMRIVFEIFIGFMHKKGVIKIEEINNYYKIAEQVLNEIVVSQSQEINEVNPIQMFYDAFEELEQTGKIALIDYKTGLVVNDSKGKFVGYVDYQNEMYYLFPETIYSEINRFYLASGTKFPISKLSLEKNMEAEGILVPGKNRRDVHYTDPNTKQKVKVIRIRMRRVED